MCCPNCCLVPDGPVDARLAQLKAEISFIETTIKRLSSRRRDLLQRTNTLSPISKLPTEILIDIFELTCESTLKTDMPITPLLFGAICRDWRQLAWSTPLLWSTVSIKVSKRPVQVKLLREWLIRAQSSPLSIYSTLDLECYGKHGPFRDIFELLLTRAEYWKTLDCVFPPVAKYSDMLQHREFPLLTSLSIRSPGSIPTNSLVAPRPTRIELSGYDLSFRDLKAFPLEQLSCFKTQGSVIKLTEALALLHCARALRECSFYRIHHDSTPTTPTLHTELERLCIRDTPFFLDSLTLPNLRVLAIEHARDRYRYSLYRSISSLVSRSSCQLERLNLVQEFPLEDDAIITLLEALPSLIHLYLTPSKPDPEAPHGLSDNIVSRLRPSQDGSCLLPRLMSFKYRGAVLCNNRLLIDMLAERWHSTPRSEFRQISRLTRAEIVKAGKSSKNLLQDVRADMDMLVSEGMQLTYKFNVATR